ncbi:MAG: class II aldolase/adducin family protein [Bacillus sp. (in: Bacteria)]|nr:class II aldolase/adducin family protein [Bacillus sp. (in: firmicutes)]
MYNFASETKLKQEICQIGKLVFDKGFVAANDGNISCRLNKDELLVTPTGISKGFVKPQDIVKVNMQGEVIAGKLKPSSELKMHLKVYEERSDIQAVVHVHPPYATAHAIAGVPLDKATMPEAVVLLGTIPIAKYGTPSTPEIPDEVGKHVHNHRGVLLENHGALTWGEDLFSAYFLMESLEFCAK